MIAQCALKAAADFFEANPDKWIQNPYGAQIQPRTKFCAWTRVYAEIVPAGGLGKAIDYPCLAVAAGALYDALGIEHPPFEDDTWEINKVFAYNDAPERKVEDIVFLLRCASGEICAEAPAC